MESLQFLSAVLLTSEKPDRLAEFYRDVLNVPLEREDHGESAPHWGCELGDLHFAIHPPENFRRGSSEDPSPEGRSGSSIKLAFDVADLDSVVEHLEEHGVEPLYPPEDRGFAVMTAIEDPDGNYIELTELSDGWYEHLERRRAEGVDILERRR